MVGPFRTPADLARALLAGPPTPARIRKTLRHARKGTRAQWDQLLALLPPDLRPTVDAAAVSVSFAG